MGLIFFRVITIPRNPSHHFPYGRFKGTNDAEKFPQKNTAKVHKLRGGGKVGHVKVQLFRTKDLNGSLTTRFFFTCGTRNKNPQWFVRILISWFMKIIP